jgi:hypothetical protein
MPNLIQERAYSNLSITLSTINKQYFELEYDVYYNYNTDDDTYTGTDFVQIIIPISNINAQLVQCKDETGQEINASIVIKNNQDTVLTLNTNEWYVALGQMQTSFFDDLIQDIYSVSFA